MTPGLPPVESVPTLPLAFDQEDAVEEMLHDLQTEAFQLPSGLLGCS